VERTPANSTSQVILAIHFPAEARRGHCSNVGIPFVLMEQILNKTEEELYDPPCLGERKDENILIIMDS
jgi:hypothetical protein